MIRKILTRGLPAVAIVAVGILIFLRLVASKPTPEVAPKKTRGTLVEVMRAEPADQRVVVEAMGTVVPARELDVFPEVGGKIIELNPDLVPGGRLLAGDVIARIDPRDYETAVEQAKAQLEDARLYLELEQGRQIVARREWSALYPSTQGSEASSDLALRKPHLASAKAKVESAESALSQATLNLDRTVIEAPFNVTVKVESVEVGELVTQQSRIATLVGSDRYWVRVSLPVSRLAWVRMPDESGGGSLVAVKHEVGSNAAIEREGRVIRLLSDLDPQGRMARLLVAVDDPLGLNGEHNSTIPLLIDAYVRVEIDAGELENIFVIPRTAIRERERVWIMDSEDRLAVRDVEIVWRRKDDVLVENHIAPGERIVASRLPTPIPGMLLRINGMGEPGDAPAQSESSQ